MNQKLKSATRHLTAIVLLGFGSTAILPAQSQTPKIVTAAESFLATLTADQRQKVLYSFDDDKQRATWSNFPIGFVPRGGINLKQMSEPQRAAAMKLMAVVLSLM